MQQKMHNCLQGIEESLEGMSDSAAKLKQDPFHKYFLLKYYSNSLQTIKERIVEMLQTPNAGISE